MRENGPARTLLCVSDSATYDRDEASALIRRMAIDLGFDLIGIAPAAPSARADYIRNWIASGQAGTMQWLNRHLEAMIDVRSFFPVARSVICVAVNYHRQLTEPSGDEPRGRIARYALGDDYHEVMKPRLHALADAIRRQWPVAEMKCGVDSSPILEREFAAASGIGWLAKNTCIINPGLGSWLLLGEVLTSLDLACDEPAKDYCGTCTRCIDACPTNAITAPYQMDPRRCISYLNIEHRGLLDEQQQRSLGNWLFGCDICQEVCPHNRKAPEGAWESFRPRFTDGTIPLDEVLAMDEQAYRERFRRSAIKRVKLPVLQANAAVARDSATRKVDVDYSLLLTRNNGSHVGELIHYARPQIVFSRPWYVWLGAVIIAGWLVIVGAASVWTIIRVSVDPHDSRMELTMLLAAPVLGLLFIGMMLVLQWRALFRRSENASAIVGSVLCLLACVALLAEAQALLSHRAVLEIASVGAIAATLIFGAFTHFRWALFVAAWLDRKSVSVSDEAVEE